MSGGQILDAAELRRYADAIVHASLGVGRGEYLLVQGEPAHRELAVAVAEAGYRAGAKLVEVRYDDPLVERALLEHGRDEALGVVSPWSIRRFRELIRPDAARAAIVGESEPGYLDGIPPRRIATDHRRSAETTRFFRRANLDLRARWTAAGWPTDFWASQVYPDVPALEAKRRLARDLLSFCRLTDADGEGASGWLAHVRAIARRSAKLTRLALAGLELRGPGTDLMLRLSPGTRWLGGREETPAGARFAPNMPTEETFTSPHASASAGTFACTFPLMFQGRLVHGLRGEFRGGRLVRLEADADDDRELVASFLDSDPTGRGRRLGEVALVDATSRIGRTGRVYYETLIDENAAAHIAFGAGFGGSRTEKPVRGVNRSLVHLDVMIGGPDLEVTGVTARGKRVPVIRDGLFAI